tara:strand:+ start:178914 stop:179423 length:510 start_codon:yes stop_codon:yes gene_type:complete
MIHFIQLGMARQNMTSDTQSTEQTLYKSVLKGAQEAAVFSEVLIDSRGVSCRALNSAEPAFYRVQAVDGQIWISMETEDRWLSGSIEGDLVNTGDKLDELIEEEVIDLGHHDAKVGFEHFRSPEMLYVFRSKLSTPMEDAKAAQHALIWLLGYEIVLRELGDMDESEED